jgi:dipeptidyl aminopeptidase/acylaminoacyl peptidase
MMADLNVNARVLAPWGVVCVLGASLLVTAAEPQLDVLDDVVVTAKKILPLEDFAEFPRYDSVAISPNGKLLAIGWTDDDTYERQLLTVQFPSMKREDSQQLQLAMGVADIRWASNTRLLVQPDYPLKGFRRAREPIGSIFVADVDRHQLRILNKEPTAFRADPLREKRDQDEASAVARARREAQGKTDKVGSSPDRNAIGPLQLISARTTKPEHMLFQTIRSTTRDGKSDGFGAFFLDMKNWEQVRQATSPVPDARFVTGPEGRIAVAYGVTDSNEQVVYHLPASARAEGTAWELRLATRGSERGLRPLAWTGNAEEYYALDNRGAGTNAVVVWNAEDNTQRHLYRHKSADMEAFAADPAGKPFVFSGSDHFPVYWYPDEAHPLAVLHKMVTKRAPDEMVDIVNATDDLSLAVVRVSSGRRAPIFVVLDVRTGRSLPGFPGFDTYPKLKATRLEPVDPVEFRARDGLMLRGYLTTPTDGNNKTRSGLPLVVITHDGPDGEPATDLRYEFERQLFASRGYAVLQVNHRGTSGRGGDFARAGDGKWGKEVQEDFADGVRWAIRDGVADANRVCIYGTGYGAYSALMAASREPSLFKCVIGVAGVYDLPAMMAEYKPGMPARLIQVLGSDMQALKIRSPVNLASTIKAKVLLVQQPGDEKVPQEQTVAMRIALKDANVDIATETIGTRYSNYFTPQDRTLVYARLLKFLDQTVAGQAR